MIDVPSSGLKSSLIGQLIKRVLAAILVPGAMITPGPKMHPRPISTCSLTTTSSARIAKSILHPSCQKSN